MSGTQRIKQQLQLSWFRIILDEAHFIKTRSTSTAKSVFALTSLNKWCLTGTPLQVCTNFPHPLPLVRVSQTCPDSCAPFLRPPFCVLSFHRIVSVNFILLSVSYAWIPMPIILVVSRTVIVNPFTTSSAKREIVVRPVDIPPCSIILISIATSSIQFNGR